MDSDGIERGVLWRGAGLVRLTPDAAPLRATAGQQRLLLLDELPARGLVRVLVEGHLSNAEETAASLTVYLEVGSLARVVRRPQIAYCSTWAAANGSDVGIRLPAGAEVSGQRQRGNLLVEIDNDVFHAKGLLPAAAVGCTYDHSQETFAANVGLLSGTTMLDRPDGELCAAMRADAADISEARYLPAQVLDRNGTFALVRVADGSGPSVIGWALTSALTDDPPETPTTSGGLVGTCPIVARVLDQRGGISIGVLYACRPPALELSGSAQTLMTSVGALEVWVELLQHPIAPEPAAGFSPTNSPD